MELKKLIDHQRIQIDDHNAGSRQPSDIDGLHIHKTFTEKRLEGKYVKIGLTGVGIDSNLSPKDMKSVMSEIRRVLKKDPQKWSNFGRSVAKALHAWSNKEISPEMARSYSIEIAGQMGLNKTI